MAKGVKIQNGEPLKNYNAKLRPETKQLLEALAKVTGKSQRELIEEFIKLYSEAKPGNIDKARQLLDLLGDGN